MIELKWKFVKHVDLSVAEKLQIAELKNQHWPYGIESQLQWMKENVKPNDVHLLGFDALTTNLLAYITIVQLIVSIDGIVKPMLGIGGVCISKVIEHSGYGKSLTKMAEAFIQNHNLQGILLCKDELVHFYKKCGWELIVYKRAKVAERKYTHNVMCIGPEFACNNIIIDRNF